ncbi:MAG: NAD+ synthase [bacterium]
MIRLGLAQINTVVGDIDGNVSRLSSVLERARAIGVDLVAFPELATTGYPPEDLLLKPDFIHANLAALDRVIPATAGISAVVGFVDADDHIYNAAALLVDGRRVGTYRKQRLPNYGVFDEKRYFHPGDACPVFVLNGVPVGVTICEDIWFPGGPPQAVTRAGAVLLVNINASPYHAGRWREREQMLRTRAQDYTAVVAYVNLVGGQDELVFDGTSVILDHTGAVVARGTQFEEELIVCDIDTDAVRRVRQQRFVRATDLEGESEIATPTVAVTAPTPQHRPSAPPHLMQPLGPTEEVYRALTLGLRDYVTKNRFKDVVLGLSGGIDSTLVAAIAVDALGSDRVHVARLPSEYTSDESKVLAGQVAANLGVQIIDIPISGIFHAYLEALAPVFAGRTPDVAEENVQARIRGTLLMALSNKFGWLLLATGNKSEYSCGYATLYGDMAGGFAVIKDVLKTLVYDLARWRNTRGEVIPARVLERAPTAELRPGQRDTDSLPSYEVLDPILRLYVEEDIPPQEIIARGFDPQTVARVVTLVDRSEYKRRQAPPGVKITPKAFGRDRRLPITNQYLSAPISTPAPSAPQRAP